MFFVLLLVSLAGVALAAVTNEHPGKDIMGRRCNAGSMNCECLKADEVLGRATCGVMSSCRADPRDGKQRCLPDASVSQK